jgi:UDP-N-acetylglucosamine 2-epimerase (non-hydrolysing)
VSKNRKKLLFVFGTRPEAIKMSPLIRIFKEREEKFDITVCVTGQHREMLDQVLELFEIKPDYDLNVMKVNQDLFQLTSDIMMGMKDVLYKEKPDLVFVHGDTTTTFLATLSAFYMKIDVAHVEAGLRTYNIYSPWPEEINRQLTGRKAQGGDELFGGYQVYYRVYLAELINSYQIMSFLVNCMVLGEG